MEEFAEMNDGFDCLELHPECGESGDENKISR